MGTIGKIFLEFDTPFWPVNDANFIGYNFLWTAADLNAIKGTDKEWLMYIMSFYLVDSYPNMIEAFYAGPLMSTFETISDDKLISDCMWLLSKFLNRSDLKRPIYMKRTNWLTNKFFLGAYSYISYASESPTVVGPPNLAEPLMKTDWTTYIHFAGEATDYDYPSFANGAVSSGWRAAQEVIDNYY